MIQANLTRPSPIQANLMRPSPLQTPAPTKPRRVQDMRDEEWQKFIVHQIELLRQDFAQSLRSISANLVPDRDAPGIFCFRYVGVVNSALKIKEESGKIFGWIIYNNAASLRVVRLYDMANQPAIGSATEIVLTIPLLNGAPPDKFISPYGVKFQSGLWIAATTGLADSDAGAPAATDVVVNILYR